jgi:hypothetical protein
MTVFQSPLRTKGYINAASLLLVLFSVSGCGFTPNIYRMITTRNLGLLNDKSKTAVVTSNNNVLVVEYEDRFNKKFGSGRNFVNTYTTVYMDKLREEQVFADVKLDPSLGLDSVNPFKQEPPDIADSVLAKVNADYLIVLWGFEINNMPTFLPQRESIRGGYNVNNVMLKCRTQVYDIKARQKVKEYLAWGVGTLFLFNTIVPLKGAMNDCVDFAVSYLQKDK